MTETPQPHRVYFATAKHSRAWGEYLFVAERREQTWRLFFWRDARWHLMHMLHFNVINNAKIPRIVIAEESYVDELARGATTTDVPWSTQAEVDDFSDWNALLRGFIDDESRDVTLESMIENGEVMFGEEDDLDASDKVAILKQTMTDEEILDLYDSSEMRLQYLLKS